MVTAEICSVGPCTQTRPASMAVASGAAFGLAVHVSTPRGWMMVARCDTNYEVPVRTTKCPGKRHKLNTRITPDVKIREDLKPPAFGRDSLSPTAA